MWGTFTTYHLKNKIPDLFLSKEIHQNNYFIQPKIEINEINDQKKNKKILWLRSIKQCEHTPKQNPIIVCFLNLHYLHLQKAFYPGTSKHFNKPRMENLNYPKSDKENENLKKSTL